MKKGLRFILVAATIIIAILFLYPTFQWYVLFSEEDRELSNSSRLQLRDYAVENADEVIERTRALVSENPGDPLPQDLQFLVKFAEDNYNADGRPEPPFWSVSSVLDAFSGESELSLTIEDYYREIAQRRKEIKSRIILLGLDLAGGVSAIVEADFGPLTEQLGEEPTDEQINDAMALAIDILTNRIDRFGITEPQIRRLDQQQISIEIPGENDRERIEAFLAGRGKLSFHIVDDAATDQLIDYQQSNADWSYEEDGAPNFVRAGTRPIEFISRDEYGIDQYIRHIVIHENIEEDGLDGVHITEAQPARDPLSGRPVVNFVLDGQGSRIFSQLTRENIGNSMAIVLDDSARAHALINEEIPNGQVNISGLSVEEADSIARVLRTASLPVELGVTNQQIIGAQLGSETISIGLRSMVLGFLLVVVFMAIYYKGAGLIANLMLTLNLFLIVAVLSVFNLTLTLTSIAGIILTVGMAVDANVIIFERMKEEYRLGKTPKASIKSGFEKAFWTVMDANITTFIAAIFLSQFGTGPIRGFAVTLSVGIATSMFTALFVSRLLFDTIVDMSKNPRLSISWKL